VIAAAGVLATTPDSVRDGRFPPVAQRIGVDDLVGISVAVRTELAALGEGRLAVLTTRRSRIVVADALEKALPPGAVVAAESDAAPVAVLTVAEAKGLEFDTVVLLEPAEILAESPRGANDLYVALTRPTQRLRVLHSYGLPAGMERLTD
jgi:DNA helicase IV